MLSLEALKIHTVLLKLQTYFERQIGDVFAYTSLFDVPA